LASLFLKRQCDRTLGDFPREYLDKIPEDVPEAAHQAYPADKPPIAWHECAEMSVSFYDTDGNGSPPLQGKYNAKWQSIVRRAYYACIRCVSQGNGWPRLRDLAQFVDCESLSETCTWPTRWSNPAVRLHA
jgi:hypothetical protein